MILLEHGPGGLPTAFTDPVEVVVARTPIGVLASLARVEAARREGRWVAGWIGYEAAAAFERALTKLPPAGGPLLVLGLFDRPTSVPAWTATPSPVRLSPPVPRWSRSDHRAAVQRARRHIAAGDCYQVNVTMPCDARLDGDPLDLYRRLLAGHPAGHAAYVELGAGPTLVSLSPELFFAVEPGGRIVTRPIKGTRPRDPDPVEDARLARELVASPKDRAENLMIVDLLRNDLARLCVPGTVRVERLFDVERYASVHQLTSTVSGSLPGRVGLADLLRALFPCGSVTGAPKIAAMRVIAELEGGPRGPYCGAIGWMAPTGEADFSVAIRTLVVDGDDVRLDVGGGIVWDSDPDVEWEEALWKTRFVASALNPA